MAFARLIILGLIALTLCYWLLRIYARSVRREALERDWDAGEANGPRDVYIAEGLARYERSLRRKLIWLVYILPIGAMIALVLMNVQW